MSSTFESLRAVIDQLGSAEEVEIRTFDKRTVKVQILMPARRQVAVIGKLEVLLGHDVVSDAVGRVQSAKAKTAGGVMSMIVAAFKVATSEAAIDSLDEVFLEAFPDACAEVCGGKRPSDVFPLEEMVAAIIPFSIGPAQRLHAVAMRGTATS